MYRVVVCAVLICALAASPCWGGSLTEAPRAEVSAPGDTLRVWQSIFSLTGFKYQYGFLKDDVGMGGGNIRSIVLEDEKALAEVETFGKLQVPSFILTVVAAGATVVGLKADNDGLAYGGLGGMVIAFVIDQIGYGHLKRGVREYNRGKRRDR